MEFAGGKIAVDTHVREYNSRFNFHTFVLKATAAHVNTTLL
jgi:hypothetical protein